ncbi:MAG: NAD(P)/FAD-dependent oxidoreductase [Thermoplasmata archaeon]
MNVDVVIIGSGIAGSSIARWLSKYNISSVVLEKNNDIGLESTSTNHSLVCQGGDSLTFRPGTLHAEVNIKSIPLWPKLAEELNFPFKRIGGLWLIRDKADYLKYVKLRSRSFRSSSKPNSPYYIPEGSFKPLEFVDRKTLLDLEPYVNQEVLGALSDPNLAIVDSYKVAKSMAENAASNGIEFIFNQEIKKIERSGINYTIKTNDDEIRASYIINAAGINADRIAEMVGARDFSYVPLKGTLTDFDEDAGKIINHEVHYLPRMEDLPNLKTAVPTVNGLFRDGIYLEMSYRNNKEIKKEAVNHNIKAAKELFPNFPFEKHIEKTFTGFMAMTNPETGWHDFIIDIPNFIPNWVNIVLGPAGVTAAPMLGEKVVDLLRMSGLKLETNPRFDPTSKRGVGK